MAALLTRRQNKWSIKVLVALIMVACYHNSLRDRSYLLQAALVPTFLSPWRKLYDEGDLFSFLHVTGLTRKAFDSLLYVVIPPGQKSGQSQIVLVILDVEGHKDVAVHSRV